MTVYPETLPDGTVGEPYAATIWADGGTPPYVFTLAPQGSLPYGLWLSPSGLLSGTPTFNAGYSFRVLATDSVGCYNSRDYHVSISEPQLPDLLGDILNVKVRGSSLDISFWCYNEGPLGAGPFRVKLFLSRSKRFGRGSQMASLVKIPGLPSKSVTRVMRVKFEASRRLKNLVLQVDSEKVIAEIDETNNLDWKEIPWR
ncbi:MAG: putative Ig domain-containing protein [Acidobacteriota bacterium]